MRKKFTDEQLMELYKQGLLDTKTAEKLGVSPRTVLLRRKKLGLAKQQWRKFTHRQFLELYKKGFSDYQIAKRLGVHQSSVWERRKKLGLSKQPWTEKTKFQKGNIPWNKKINDEKILNLHNLGYSDHKIVKKLGVPRWAVYKIRKKHHLPKVPTLLREVNRRKPGLQKFSDDEFLKLYNLKWPDEHIAEKLGVSFGSVQARRYYLGLPPNHKPKGGRKRKFSRERFFKLYNKGYDDIRISQILKVSVGAVTRVRWQHQLPPNGVIA